MQRTGADAPGVLLREAGRAEEAEAEYREAISLDPQDPKAQINLGSLLREAGRSLPANVGETLPPLKLGKGGEIRYNDERDGTAREGDIGSEG